MSDHLRHIVVTGGATGIGRASAIELARGGDHVFILNRNAGAAEDVVGRYPQGGRKSGRHICGHHRPHIARAGF